FHLLNARPLRIKPLGVWSAHRSTKALGFIVVDDKKTVLALDRGFDFGNVWFRFLFGKAYPRNPWQVPFEALFHAARHNHKQRILILVKFLALKAKRGIVHSVSAIGESTPIIICHEKDE